MGDAELADKFAGLERMLGDLIDSNADLSTSIEKRNVLVTQQGKDLAEIKTALATFVPWTRFRTFVATIVIFGVMMGAVLATTLSLNHRTTCGIRGVIVLAQTTILSRPAPTDEESLRRRDEALAFYDTSLRKLKILWPCAGERSPSTSSSRE